MPATAISNPGRAGLQRAQGAARLSTGLLEGRTRLRSLYQDGCAKIRFPHTHDASLEAVLINTAGGLTGGDRVNWDAQAAAGARLVLTSQACERVYRSLGPSAEVRTRLTAGAGSRIDWLPQETILFEHSRLDRSLDVELDDGATLLALEAVLLGREAMGESARGAMLRDNWRIYRNGRLIHAEATRLSGEPLVRDTSSLLDGALAFASLLYVGADAEHLLPEVRRLLFGRCGASVVGDRLVVRAVADSGLALRRLIVPIVTRLSGAGSLPRLWHL